MKISDFLPTHGATSAANLFGVFRRRVWSQPGKAHIELPDLGAAEFEEFASTLSRELEALDGVHWASANGALSRMVIAWDEDRIDLDTINEVIDELEDRYSLEEGLFCSERPSHPGDDEPFTRGLAQMGANLVGAAVGSVLKVARRKPGRRQFDAAALMSVIDNVPHIRGGLANRFGRSLTDMAIGLANPLAQGVGSGPVGPTLDLFHQATQLLEAVERRQTWERMEPLLCSRPDRAASPRPMREARPIPIPQGPIEDYAENAWNMSLGGFLVGLADTQQLESAITPVLDALPKPARYGRNAFSARISRRLGERDMVILNPDALRRLDRIDCIVVDDNLLIGDQWRLDRVHAPQDLRPVKAYARAETLLDPLHPELTRRDGEWTLTPASCVEVDDAWEFALREEGARGDLLALQYQDETCALFSIRQVTDRASKTFIDAIHQAGLELILASDDGDADDEFHAHRVVDHDGLERFIRHIQRDHQVVAFFGNGSQPAMTTADINIGFALRGASLPWEADILSLGNLDDGTVLIQAINKARSVSEKCAVLAGAGAGIGALSAIRGLEKAAPGRVMLSVNLASLIALAYGTLRARRLNIDFETEPEAPAPWHRMDVDEVLSRVQSTTEGLTEEQALSRDTDTDAPQPRWRKVAGAIGQEVANPLTPVLAAGAAVSAVVGSVTDASIVGAVIAFNGLVGGYERFRAEDRIDAMARTEAIQVRGLRDGDWRLIDEDELVVGDIITLESGDVVPADCRIIESARLEVDESSLTGESLPVYKDATPTFSKLVAQRSSMLYEGTAIVAGTTTAVVVAIGSATEAGRSQWLGQQNLHDRAPSGVEARLEEFSKMTVPVVGFSGGILLSLGVFRRRKLKELVGPAVNLAVGAVPEGLPLLATAAQLAAARRLADRNVVVHNPRALEALGRADILCIDKTGTLTHGTLTLNGICDGSSHCRVDDEWAPHYLEICRAALRATPLRPEQGIFPHATDRAISEGVLAAGVDAGDWQPLEQIPFKAELGFHAALGLDGGRQKLVIKGSPEEVLARCTGRRSDGKWVKMTQTWHKKLLARGEKLASRGLRILAVAQRQFQNADGPLKPSDIQGLTFYGFVTLSDPLRPTARQAVEALQSAGVSLLMLTGDHPETARRIARDVGIFGSRDVITGDEMDALDDEELAKVLTETSIIARMTPAHKVRIVQALQSAGRTVAMSGDGGNDAAALRFSDVGIALGRDSSSAARDAADLVVTDARIGTIVDALIEGRAMWRSVRDAVSILIGGNLGEVGFMLASGVVNTIPALNARQLLLVNLFTDVAPAMAIALRPPPHISPQQLLHEGPEQSLGAELEHDIMWRAAITAAAAFTAWMIARHTFQGERAATVALLAVVFAQLGQTLTAGRPTLPVWAASLGTVATLLAIVETPGISQLLGCKPLGPFGLTTAFASAAAATAASAVIPRIGPWRRALADRIDLGEEPAPEDFFLEFLAAHDLRALPA